MRPENKRPAGLDGYFLVQVPNPAQLVTGMSLAERGTLVSERCLACDQPITRYSKMPGQQLAPAGVWLERKLAFVFLGLVLVLGAMIGYGLSRGVPMFRPVVTEDCNAPGVRLLLGCDR
jgi:hypothetical protein